MTLVAADRNGDDTDPGAVGPAGGGDRPGRSRRRRRRRRRSRWLVWPLAALLVLTSYVGVTFLQVWRASGRDGARTASAVVVLGAAQYDGRPSPVLKNRLDHALALYEAGTVPRIVVTGGRQEGDRFTEATSGYNYLRDRGVPDEDLIKEVQGTTTYESLAAVARFSETQGIDDVVLVSGPAQAKRLAGIASDVGLEAAISPTEGDASTRSLVRETVAVSAGRLLGYRRLERFDR